MHLIAGDIGGTKTLLGIYKYSGTLELIYKKYYLSNEWTNFESLLMDFVSKWPKDLEWPKYGCIGVAGNVNGGKVSLTNLSWEINQSHICNLLNLKNLLILNDFYCLIHAIPFINKNQFAIIQNFKSNSIDIVNNSPITIIGAGTGLGVARALFSKNRIEVLASEAGHTEFAPRCEKEWELSLWLKKIFNLKRISIERVISGTGLGNIARWRVSRGDIKNHPIMKIIKDLESQNKLQTNLPAIVSQLANEGDNLMKEVLEMWLSAYGSAAGDIALHELCNGGLWIAGGTAYKQLEGIRSSKFLDAFKNKGRFTDYLDQLPVIALIDSDAGLFGAACKAHLISKSSVRIT